MSTSNNPVVADQQVSRRRSVSASMSSTGLGTKRNPRHRSRARRHNNEQQRRARASRHDSSPCPRAWCESGPGRDRCARRSGTARPRAAGARLAEGDLRLPPRAGRPRRPRPAGRRWRARWRVLPSSARRGGRCRRQRQRLPVEGRGPIEGERGARFLGGKAGLNRRVLGVSGAPIVLEQRLAVVASSLDERLHHAAVDPAHGVGGNLRGEHLANPIVIGLDPLRRAAAANEVGGAEHRHERLPARARPARSRR